MPRRPLLALSALLALALAAPDDDGPAPAPAPAVVDIITRPDPPKYRDVWRLPPPPAGLDLRGVRVWVTRSGEAGGAGYEQPYTPTSPGVTVYGLAEGSRYTLRIAWVDKSGVPGPQSEPLLVTVTRPPPPPGQPTLQARLEDAPVVPPAPSPPGP